MAEPLEERVSKLEQARREIEENMLVMAHLETKQSKAIKAHAEWLEQHAQLMREFDEKLNALINFTTKRDGLPKGGHSK